MKATRGICHRKDGRYMWRFQHKNRIYLGYALRFRDAERDMVLKKAEIYQAEMPGKLSEPDTAKSRESTGYGTAGKTQETLDSIFPRWIEEKRKRCKELTCYTYRHNYKNCLRQALGTVPVTEISAEMITDTMDSLARRYSRTIINTNITILNGLLAYAVRQKILRENPMKSAVLPATAPWSRKPVLDRQEERDLLTAVKDSRFASLYRLAAYTGMRIGEICGLCWEDIDWDHHWIHVTHTLDYTSEHGLYLESPKTKTSRRIIPMLPRTEELLHRCRDQQQRWKEAAGDCWKGAGKTESLVFTTPLGRPIYQGSINYDLRQIRETMKSAGKSAKHFTFHTFRHSFATRCIEEGMNYKTLQTILGHSSMKTTMDIYTHCLPDTMMNELREVDKKAFAEN